MKALTVLALLAILTGCPAKPPHTHARRFTAATCRMRYAKHQLYHTGNEWGASASSEVYKAIQEEARELFPDGTYSDQEELGSTLVVEFNATSYYRVNYVEPQE